MKQTHRVSTCSVLWMWSPPHWRNQMQVWCLLCRVHTFNQDRPWISYYLAFQFTIPFPLSYLSMVSAVVIIMPRSRLGNSTSFYTWAHSNLPDSILNSTIADNLFYLSVLEKATYDFGSVFLSSSLAVQVLQPYISHALSSFACALTHHCPYFKPFMNKPRCPSTTILINPSGVYSAFLFREMVLKWIQLTRPRFT